MLLSIVGYAQPGNTNCGTCVVDTDCPTISPDGGLCPEMIPDGQVGEPYDFSVTFFMPETITVTEPIETDVTLIDVEITDLVNLPAGLEWSCSNADCTYAPSSNPPDSELGCIRICGTPNAAPGDYEISIRLLADVFVSALNTTLPDQEQFYTAMVTILPPDVPIVFNELVGCGSLSDDLSAIADFNPVQPTFWSWNVDGTVSDGKDVSYEFTSPGSYDIILETTVFDYVVTEVCINSISDGYCGDIEEPICNCGTPIVGVCPDPYVSLLGTSLPTANGTDNNCWNGLSIPTGGLNFNLSAFDEDNGPPLGSDNDLLGDFTIDIDNGEGSYSFSNDNMSGTITVGTVLNSVTTDTLTVTVNDLPTAPMISQDGDDLLITNDDGYIVQWYLDGDAIDGATDNSVTVAATGEYFATVTDANGCTSTTDPFNAIAAGIENVLTDAQVSALYPNPAKEAVYLAIDFANTHDIQLNITDALGKSVYQISKTAQSGEQIYTLDISGISSGLYFVQIRLDDGSQMTQKLTIF